MEIEEWRPPPLPPLLPEKPRRNWTALTVSLIMAGVFVATLAVLNWHNLTARTEPDTAVSEPATTAQAINAPPAHELSAQATENLTTIAECIPDSVLASQDRDRVIKMLMELARSADPVALAAFGGPVDMQAVTTMQASGFVDILSRVQEPLGSKARKGFQTGMQDGTCKIATSPLFA